MRIRAVGAAMLRKHHEAERRIHRECQCGCARRPFDGDRASLTFSISLTPGFYKGLRVGSLK